jgi:hypothetical protein
MTGDLLWAINEVGATGLDMTTGILTGTFWQFVGFGIAIGVVWLAIMLYRKYVS